MTSFSSCCRPRQMGGHPPCHHHHDSRVNNPPGLSLARLGPVRTRGPHSFVRSPTATSPLLCGAAIRFCSCWATTHGEIWKLSVHRSTRIFPPTQIRALFSSCRFSLSSLSVGVGGSNRRCCRCSEGKDDSRRLLLAVAFSSDGRRVYSALLCFV